METEKLTLSTRSSSIPRTRRKQKNTRGYGRSKIPSLRWLTTDQAMADYADLILELRSANSTVFEARNPAPAASLSSSTPPKLDFSSSPLRGGAAGAAVIGFGGSYGGMLAAWMRMRYPSAVDGVVAASAPIWSYGGLDPEFDAGSFAATVTDDAGPKGGASEACSENVREAWKVLFASVEDENGEPGEGGRVTPAAASAALRLCSPSGAAGGEHQSRALATREDAQLVADWASAAFDSCAMGMFPYPSSYMLNGDAELPAWPMRAICGGRLSEANLTGVAVLEALAEGISVYFNATRDAVCYDPLGGGGSSSDATDEDGSLWGWQYCSQVRLRERARERAREMEKFLDFVCFASLRGGLLRGRARSVDRERAGYAFLRPRTIFFSSLLSSKKYKTAIHALLQGRRQGHVLARALGRRGRGPGLPRPVWRRPRPPLRLARLGRQADLLAPLGAHQRRLLQRAARPVARRWRPRAARVRRFRGSRADPGRRAPRRPLFRERGRPSEREGGAGGRAAGDAEVGRGGAGEEGGSGGREERRREGIRGICVIFITLLCFFCLLLLFHRRAGRAGGREVEGREVERWGRSREERARERAEVESRPSFLFVFSRLH